MTIIYCIEDINDLRYIGITNRKLNTRLTEHKYKKNNNLYCSSSLLNLYNCIIYKLEECEENEKQEREKYWINNIECVNEIKYNFDKKKYNREYQNKYYHDNIDKMRQYNNQYYNEKYKRQ